MRQLGRCGRANLLFVVGVPSAHETLDKRTASMLEDNATMGKVPEHHRRVRSFVKRHGRLTTAQRAAIDRLFPQWGIEFDEGPLELDEVFGRRAPRVLDIGFGDGEALVSAAAATPGVDYVGVEVHEPGVGRLLLMLEQASLSNVRVINKDVVDVIDTMLAGARFDAVNIYFPDPWPKKRHHKRRLVQLGFLDSLSKLMGDSALLHIATDWAHYVDHIQDVVRRNGGFARLDASIALQDPLAYRPPTKFERRGRALGHSIADLYYRRVVSKRVQSVDQ